MDITAKNPITLLLLLKQGPLYNSEGYKLSLNKDRTAIIKEFAPKCATVYANLVSINLNLCGETYSRRKPIPDKALVLCWDSDWGCRREIRFYDAENNCTFSRLGSRDCLGYDNYRIIEPDSNGLYTGEFEWANEAKKRLAR